MTPRLANCYAPAVLICLIASLATASCAIDPPPTYSNPILAQDQRGGADPDVIFYKDTYYFYSTNPGNNVFTSKDLIHWTKGPQVLPDEFKGIWAPEVYYHPEDGKFYMYYTRRYKIGVAVADRPDAMFKDLGLLVIDAIDADIFRDDDGRLYLYFTHTPTFTMYCVPMKSPTQTGGPVTKCFEISQPWEKHSFPINEGPWMLKHDGAYYLLYSGSDGQSIDYALGYATGPTPIGPFTKYAANPFFQNLPKVLGPGHNSVIRDRNGQLWCFYHQKTQATHGWARDICIDPLHFDDQGVLHGTPTRGLVQTAPACDPAILWSPDIHPGGALFNKSIAVTLTTNSQDTEIRYTLDGTDPAPSSPLYEKPLTLDKTTTVKARTFHAGSTPSAIAVTHFTQTAEPLPPNPSPDAQTPVPPFKVFPQPEANYQPPPKK